MHNSGTIRRCWRTLRLLRRLQHILETHFADTARGRTLKSDGTWHIAHVTAAKAHRSQEQFAREMTKRARQANE